MRPFLINHNCVLNPWAQPISFDAAWDTINGNSGNSLIAHALAKHVDFPCPIEGVNNIFKQRDKAHVPVPEGYTHAILFLQDHLNPELVDIDWEGLTNYVISIDVPILVVSLGVGGSRHRTPKAIAGGLSRACAKFFQELADRTISMGVRGNLTAGVLDELGIKNYAVVGCPTFFEAGAGRRVIARPNDEQWRVAGMGLFGTYDPRANLSFVLQSERELVELLHGPQHKPVRRDALSLSHPGFAPSIVRAFMHERVRFFTDPPAWKQFLSGGFDLAVGTRMHGAITALNAGVPALVTAGDTRAEEMCELFAIPSLPRQSLAESTIEELANLADPRTLNAKYDDLYNTFTSWLASLNMLSTFDRNPADDWPWLHMQLHDASETQTRLISGLLS